MRARRQHREVLRVVSLAASIWFESLFRVVVEQPQRGFGDEVVANPGRVRTVPEEVAVGVLAHRVHDHVEADQGLREL